MEQSGSGVGQKKSQASLQFFSNYGLAAFLGLLVVVFSAILPDTFPTAFNLRTMLNTQSVVLLLALAEMIPLSTDNFDLSVGYLVGMVHIVTISLLNSTSLPWWLIALLVLIMGSLYGFFNGTLVTRVGIHAFIATLGSGTILYGIGFWITGGAQVLGKDLPEGFLTLGLYLSGFPVSLFFVIVIGVVLWIVYEYLPLGRYFYALGSNTRAAELVGISRVKYVTMTFIASSFIVSIAGLILASQLRVAQISTGPNYLLPAFTGALLGATSIRPGRMNVGGTVVAVLLLAVAVSGLQQMGAEFFVEPLFNGSMLIVAVSFAIYTARRRVLTTVTVEELERNESNDQAQKPE
jgi:ribose transport system permease protein